jgi:hypothetical protein
MDVLHVIGGFSQGGAARALLSAASACTAAGVGQHRIASLTAAAAPMVAAAAHQGIPAVDAGKLPRALEAADIVVLHFWNCPEVYEFLASELPPLRLVMWSHVAGDRPPQILTDALVGLADRAVASCPYTVRHMPRLSLIEAFADPRRAAGPQRSQRSDPGFTVGYIGSLDDTKVHPDFVALHRSIPQVIVCGDGNLRARFEQQSDARFVWRGYVGNPGAALADFDAFGYPLHPCAWEGSELVLQEAMLAGIPPVVLATGGATGTVEHEVTGLLADTPAGYVDALNRLARDLDERRRLGGAAQALARERWAPDLAVARWDELLTNVLRSPKRRRTWSQPATGAERFIASLGGHGAAFATSARSSDDDAILEAEATISRCSPQLRGPASGGVLHYRAHHLEDWRLRLWAGLVLAGDSRHVLAAAEFAAAARCGGEHWRLSWYLARSARALGDHALERRALANVPANISRA